MKDALTKQWIQAIDYDDFHEERFQNKQQRRRYKMDAEFKIIEEEIQQMIMLKQIQESYGFDPDDENVYHAIDKIIADTLEDAKFLKFDDMLINDAELIELDKKQAAAFEESEKLYNLMIDYPDFIYGSVGPLPKDIDESLKDDEEYQRMKKDAAAASKRSNELIDEITKYSDNIEGKYINRVIEYVNEQSRKEVN